jgi:mono/diheme cytochrome c family protein
MRAVHAYALTFLAGGGLWACTQVAMPDATEGFAVYAEHCAVCHGADSRGTGPMAAELDPAPADLTRIAARNGGVFPAAQVLSKIDGYARDTGQGPAMPEFGALLGGDLVPVDVGDDIFTPTPRKLAALHFYLESIQRP